MTQAAAHLRDWPDLLGFAAAGLVLVTFYVRSGTAMRAAAIASNLLFIAYAGTQELLPVLMLHALLLPLNVWRLCEVTSTTLHGRRGFEERPQTAGPKCTSQTLRPAARRVRPLSQRPLPPQPPPPQ